MSDDMQKTALPPHLQAIAEKIGLKGGWVVLRMFWDEAKGEYDKTEESYDGENWEPHKEDANTISIRFVGGPKDGKTEW